jgi:hypothetical protein
VLRRLIGALEAEPDTACPVCSDTHIVWRQDLEHEPWSGPVCTGCGIVVPQPVLTAEAVSAAKRAGRRELASVA